jgi:hypothetical protein
MRGGAGGRGQEIGDCPYFLCPIFLLQTDSGGTTSRDYTYNPQLYGELISQSNLFHHYDALGSTDRLTDASENVDTSYLYKAFGEQRSRWGRGSLQAWARFLTRFSPTERMTATAMPANEHQKAAW